MALPTMKCPLIFVLNALSLLLSVLASTVVGVPGLGIAVDSAKNNTGVTVDTEKSVL